MNSKILESIKLSLDKLKNSQCKIISTINNNIAKLNKKILLYDENYLNFIRGKQNT